MIRKITEAILIGQANVDYWFSNTTFNKLLNEAKDVRLTEEGYIELCFENAKIGVDLKEEIYNCDNREISHVKMVYAEIKDKGYKINDEIKTKNKECVIL